MVRKSLYHVLQQEGAKHKTKSWSSGATRQNHSITNQWVRVKACTMEKHNQLPYVYQHQQRTDFWPKQTSSWLKAAGGRNPRSIKRITVVIIMSKNVIQELGSIFARSFTEVDNFSPNSTKMNAIVEWQPTWTHEHLTTDRDKLAGKQ
jgi:hypothetical protein